jgi:hypothetical protein
MIRAQTGGRRTAGRGQGNAVVEVVVVDDVVVVDGGVISRGGGAARPRRAATDWMAVSTYRSTPDAYCGHGNPPVGTKQMWPSPRRTAIVPSHSFTRHGIVVEYTNGLPCPK